MSTTPNPGPSIAARPPLPVILGSGGAALVGLVASISSLLILARNWPVAASGPMLAVTLYDAVWTVCGVLYAFLVGAVSAVAAIDYWHRRRRGLAAQLLALLLLLPLVSIAPVGVALLAASFAILAIMAAYMKAEGALVIISLAIGLTLATFFYQRMGPAVGKYGTECIPIEDCFRPLLGGGFPLQYVVDIPGITIPLTLGSEDELRLLPFASDILVFAVFGYVGYRAIRYAGSKSKPREGKD